MKKPRTIRNVADFYAAIAQNIDEAGQHLQAVFSTSPAEPAFIYTIGNQELGLPELLILGGCDRQFGAILNDLGRRQRLQKRAFRPGELVSLGGQFPLKMIDAPPEAKEIFAIQVGRYYGIRPQDFRLQQAVLCDKQGRFPGDAGCEKPYADQLSYRRMN